VAIDHPRGRRRRALAWMVAGALVVALPSLVDVLANEPFASMWYWNVVFPHQAGWAGELRIEYPLLVALAALAWLRVARAPAPTPGLRTLAVVWAGAAATFVLIPQSKWYAQGIWHTTGVMLAWALPRGPAPETARSRRPVARAVMLALIAIPPLALAARPLLPPARAMAAARAFRGQLALLDWLGATAGPGPVMCVVPYHPMHVPDLWHMTNAWWYLRVDDPELARRLDDGLEGELDSGRATVIAWDPYATAGPRSADLLHHAVATGVIAPARIVPLAGRLIARYRLVAWSGPLEPSYAGERFLVRRDRPVERGVTVLPDSLVRAAARDAAGMAPP